MDLLHTLAAADEALLRALRGSPAWATALFVGVTFAGGGWGLFGLVPLLGKPSVRPKIAWMLAAIAATSALVSLLKALFGRARPCDALAGCDAIFIASPGGHSFPSGHAAGSFTFAAFVMVVWPRLSLPALVFAALVAWSRCFLGVHYPSDITAGALLGSCVGVGFASLARREASPRELWLQLKGSSRSGSRSRAASRPGPGDT